jgi:MT-A70
MPAKGSPVFVDTRAFPCCFEAPRREHSRKPKEFYEVISRVTLGPRLDIFSRESRAGFAQFGNEISKFEAACGQVSIGRERGGHLRENVATFDKNAGHQKGNKQRQADTTNSGDKKSQKPNTPLPSKPSRVGSLPVATFEDAHFSEHEHLRDMPNIDKEMSAFEDAHPLNATGNQNAMRQVRRRVTAQVRPGQFLGELEYVAVEFKWTPDLVCALRDRE